MDNSELSTLPPPDPPYPLRSLARPTSVPVAFGSLPSAAFGPLRGLAGLASAPDGAAHPLGAGLHDSAFKKRPRAKTPLACGSLRGLKALPSELDGWRRRLPSGNGYAGYAISNTQGPCPFLSIYSTKFN